MTDTKHTPGPWVIGNRYTNQGVYAANGDLIANTHGSQRNFDRDEQIAEQDANARLIAAAPELLEALEIIEQAETKTANATVRKMAKIARAAIAKAKGEGA